MYAPPFYVLFLQPFHHRLIKDGCQIGLPAVFEADPALIGHGITGICGNEYAQRLAVLPDKINRGNVRAGGKSVDFSVVQRLIHQLFKGIQLSPVFYSLCAAEPLRRRLSPYILEMQ